jgi:S1-C subfamily serine protease
VTTPRPVPPRLVAVALAAATLLAPVAASAAGRSNPRAATVQKVFPAAVRLQLLAAGKVVRSASGVAFARDGGSTYVLTNAHVVEPDPSWKEPVVLHVLATGRKAPLAAKVVARGQVPDVDLAVVEVADADLPLAALASDDALELGDDLVVIGAPFGKGLSVAAGIISQVEYEFPEAAGAPRVPRSLKTDAAIGYGSSGGGVFEVPSGRLVGLVEGYRTARVAFGAKDEYAFDVPMPGETFVAPAAKIRHFLGERGLAKLVGPGRPDAASASAQATHGRATPRVSRGSGVSGSGS